jgi:hypothetical protein
MGQYNTKSLKDEVIDGSIKYHQLTHLSMIWYFNDPSTYSSFSDLVFYWPINLLIFQWFGILLTHQFTHLSVIWYFNDPSTNSSFSDLVFYWPINLLIFQWFGILMTSSMWRCSIKSSKITQFNVLYNDNVRQITRDVDKIKHYITKSAYK